MSLRTDTFELGGLHLAAGEARRLGLHVAIEPFELGGERYLLTDELVPVCVDVSRTTGEGYALRMRFEAALDGPCVRCLEPAPQRYAVDAREVSQPGASDELDSPYVEHGVLDLRGWAREALALVLPAKPLCRPDCAGLCPVCGADLNAAGSEHGHEREPDPRWGKLSELRFD